MKRVSKWMWNVSVLDIAPSWNFFRFEEESLYFIAFLSLFCWMWSKIYMSFVLLGHAEIESKIRRTKASRAGDRDGICRSGAGKVANTFTPSFTVSS